MPKPSRFTSPDDLKIDIRFTPGGRTTQQAVSMSSVVPRRLVILSNTCPAALHMSALFVEAAICIHPTQRARRRECSADGNTVAVAHSRYRGTDRLSNRAQPPHRSVPALSTLKLLPKSPRSDWRLSRSLHFSFRLAGNQPAKTFRAQRTFQKLNRFGVLQF